MSDLANLSKSLSLNGFKGIPTPKFPSLNKLNEFIKLGSQLWMDTGDLESALPLWKSQFTALTTNNTLANQVVQKGIMDFIIKKAYKEIKSSFPNISNEELIIELGFIVNCKIALQLIEYFGVKVSVELHPKFANDIEKSLIFARRYFDVCPEKFVIKVPLTPAGYLITRILSLEGIPVNFTLGFSARQNYLAVLISNPAYVNVFLGRLNQVAIENKLGSGKYIGEKATISTQLTLNELRNKNNSIKSNLIAASIRNPQQVIDLAGVNILTIPPTVVSKLYELLESPVSIQNQLEKDFIIDLNDENMEYFSVLWEIPKEFIKFCEDLKSDLDKNTSLNGNHKLSTLNNNYLHTFAHKHGIKSLFYNWSAEELQLVTNKGKIPDLGIWKDKVALDELMSVSALKSFEVDQNELDSKIQKLIS